VLRFGAECEQLLGDDFPAAFLVEQDDTLAGGEQGDGPVTEQGTLLAKSVGVSGCRQAVGGAQGVDAGGASLGGGVGIEPGAQA
jgi:hypothetical protein